MESEKQQCKDIKSQGGIRLAGVEPTHLSGSLLLLSLELRGDVLLHAQLLSREKKMCFGTPLERLWTLTSGA